MVECLTFCLNNRWQSNFSSNDEELPRVFVVTAVQVRDVYRTGFPMGFLSRSLFSRLIPRQPYFYTLIC